LSIDASVAWSQTNTTGYTSGENRAKGDPPYVRGVTAQPALIDIAGVATGYHTGDSCALKGQKEKEKEKEKEDKYAFTAPICKQTRPMSPLCPRALHTTRPTETPNPVCRFAHEPGMQSGCFSGGHMIGSHNGYTVPSSGVVYGSFSVLERSCFVLFSSF